MNNKFFICLIYFLFFVFSIAEVRAANIEKFNFQSENKIIRLEGLCDQKARVYIFPANSSNPLYTAESECRDGKYRFQDNLGYWKLPAGAYKVKVYDESGFLSESSSEEVFNIEDAPLEIQADLIEQISEQNEASTSEPLNQPEPPNQSEPDFLLRIINAIIDWLKSAIVMIKELVVEKITASKICLGETCVIEDQLKKLLGEEQGELPLEELPPEENQISSTTAEELIIEPAAETGTSTTATSTEIIE